MRRLHACTSGATTGLAGRPVLDALRDDHTVFVDRALEFLVLKSLEVGVRPGKPRAGASSAQGLSPLASRQRGVSLGSAPAGRRRTGSGRQTGHPTRAAPQPCGSEASALAGLSTPETGASRFWVPSRSLCWVREQSRVWCPGAPRQGSGFSTHWLRVCGGEPAPLYRAF